MRKFNNLFQNKGKLLLPLIKPYFNFDTEAKQIIFQPKTVLFLCRKAESKIEQLISLNPHKQEGLIAEIQHDNLQAKIHFTPETITLTDDYVEGQLKLLNQPDIKSDSPMWNLFIGGWKVFLGGKKVPQSFLPENIRVEDNRVYYKFPREQIKVLNLLCQGIENRSKLLTTLKEGMLIINSDVAFDWKKIDIQQLLLMLTELKNSR